MAAAQGADLFGAVAEDVVAFVVGVGDTGVGTEAAELVDIIPTINGNAR